MDKARLAGLAVAGTVAGYFIYNYFKKEGPGAARPGRPPDYYYYEEEEERRPPEPPPGRPGVEPKIMLPPEEIEFREPGVPPPGAVEIKAAEQPVETEPAETPVAGEVPEEMPKQPQPVERGYPSFIWEKQPPQPRCKVKIIDTNYVNVALARAHAREYCQAMGCTGRHRLEGPLGYVEFECVVEMP